MFYGKARKTEYFGGVIYYTRKDKRFIEWGHNCNPGKENKKLYNRALRRGKFKNFPFKNSQWKKASCADLWNWC